jgi:acetyl-CoA carboxylase biotin carboxyl carrier protein
MSVEILAPMPGNIIEILVKAGDEVKEDDELLILEAMKMENPICAPSDGVVKEVRVKEKDVVEVDQLLVVLE